MDAARGVAAIVVSVAIVRAMQQKRRNSVQWSKNDCILSAVFRRGAKGGKPQKVPRSTFLEAKGLLRRSLFP